VRRLLVLLLAACGETAAPPGPRADEPAAPLRLQAPVESGVLPAVADDGEPGHGDRIASIAMRNWVYLQPDPESDKLGYLRAGAVVDRARSPAGTNGCPGGWYRIAPRGYVCVGNGASLELDHPVVRAAFQPPRRGAPVPYHYVMSRSPPPELYFKLPSVEEQRAAEGKDREKFIGLYGATMNAWLGPADTIPDFLAAGAPLPKPYGADRDLSVGAHRGRAREESAFGLMSTFDWQGRRFGLTTELDVIALDRTKPAKLSEMHGIEIEDEGVPAFVTSHGVRTYAPDATGHLVEKGDAAYRSGWVLTGKDNGAPTGLLETTAGVWLPAGALRIAKVREDPEGYARDGRKWIDVSIRKQLLVAYEGKRPVYATLVSTGRGEMGDPAETHATVRGAFRIASKHISGTMDGSEATREDAFDLRDVPYIQYFYEGYALHGAYWHDEFGKVRSHGCINLAPADAAWLFEWTDPPVPEGWHGAVSPSGTLVVTHP
jgi:L,D-transpeptidase-like protein